MDNISLKKESVKLQVIVMGTTKEWGKCPRSAGRWEIRGRQRNWELKSIGREDMFMCSAGVQEPMALGDHWVHAGRWNVFYWVTLGKSLLFSWPPSSFPLWWPMTLCKQAIMMMVPTCDVPLFEKTNMFNNGVRWGQDFRWQKSDKIGHEIQRVFLHALIPCFPFFL